MSSYLSISADLKFDSGHSCESKSWFVIIIKNEKNNGERKSKTSKFFHNWLYRIIGKFNSYNKKP